MRAQNFLISLFFSYFVYICQINQNRYHNNHGISRFSIKNRILTDMDRGLYIMKTLCFLINNKIITKEEFVFLNKIINHMSEVSVDFIKFFEQLRIG